MSEYRGKVAVVTGAASGIGEAIAAALLDAGATVLAADIATIGDYLEGRPGTLLRRRLDVANATEWRDALAAVVAEAGRLDLLVNVAGILEAGGIEAVEPEALMRVLDVNAKGVFIGCREAIGIMKGQTTPSGIVNVASANAVKAQSWTSVYAASKAAVVSLTRTTALHCAENGYPIRVNAILPGIVRTPMVERLLAQGPDFDAALKHLESFHPIGRLLRPDEIASVALFLGSSAASGITGAAIAVDGGMTAG
jgi:NAD(P)-dependent dehydrogenase (short-subunit alcohol dehydrogenase family)